MTEQIKRIYPKRGNVYTLRDVLSVLFLHDSPSLMFYHINEAGNEVESVIQDAHIGSNEEWFAIPDFAESNWRYVRTTDEDIPVFQFVRACDDIMKYVVIERAVDYDTGEETEREEYFVIPKGTVRVQDYYLSHPAEYEAKYGKPLPK